MIKYIKLLFVKVKKNDALIILNKLIANNFTISIVNRTNTLDEAKRFLFEHEYNLVFINCDDISNEIFNFRKLFLDKEIVWNLILNNPSYSFMRQSLKMNINDVIISKYIKNEGYQNLEKYFSNSVNDIYIDKKEKLSIMLSNMKDNQDVDKYNFNKLLLDTKLINEMDDYYMSIIRIDDIVYWYRILSISRKYIESTFSDFISNNIKKNIKVIYSKKHTAIIIAPSKEYDFQEFKNILKNLMIKSKEIKFSISVAYISTLVNLKNFMESYQKLIKLQQTKFYYGKNSLIDENNDINFSNSVKMNKIFLNILNSINRNNLKNAIYFTNHAIDNFIQHKVYPDKCKEFFYELINVKFGTNRHDFNAYFIPEIYQLLIRSSDDIYALKINAKTLVRALIQHNKQLDLYKNNQYIIKAKEFISNNIEKKISLEDISLYINISESYFSRIFKKKMNISFIEYVNICKIEHSKHLLMDANLSINEISYKLGFSNQFYFSKIFKKVEGKTPSEYRLLNKAIKE